MIIRSVEINDLSDIVNLLSLLMTMHQEIDEEYFKTEEDVQAYLKQWAERHLNSSSQFLLVAEETQEKKKKIVGFIAGYIKFLFPWYKTKSVGHISFLAIDPEFQKSGYGRKLNEAAEKWFKERNLKYIELYSNERNSSGQKAWNSYGYKPFNIFFRKKIS
ncbi:hypothetical protein A2W14_01705 [Candidatus Gottesmanbacteria bacterium RBG_16_37_8]|uniref:N-acetyltransferase domain-containing protein n=1 Tax=Candidatus Gottesmanbacteria bacterium RBG_16_37_8 TaxID=1798371 RepID=A0A1F5YQV8_9BACT|nr:MAG: hypothetical protein A2W14_01705 [Candidatus Gottesmanbacteria bacterium RBG_16_37_8]